MAFIRCQNVSVVFPIYGAGTRSLRKTLMRVSTGGLISKDSDDRIVVEALKDITIDFFDGDRIALIGHNGAGKTTMLRMLAGIYEPTGGRVWVEGRVSTLLELGVGIDPEATGIENIYLRGAIMGLSKKEIRSKIDEVIDFTELGDYISMPVRTYSSGMALRLAFAVSTLIQPDILLVDEIISVGDAGFMKKAENRMKELIQNAKILLISSHSLDILKRICNKVLLLEHGKIKLFSTMEEFELSSNTLMGSD